MPAAERAKVYPSFIVVIFSYNEVKAHYTIKAANKQAAAKDAAVRLKQNDIDNFDARDVEEYPEAYTVVIYQLADKGQKYVIKSAGIVLEEAGA